MSDKSHGSNFSSKFAEIFLVVKWMSFNSFRITYKVNYKINSISGCEEV